MQKNNFMGSFKKKFSVIIVTYNSEWCISPLLHSLEAQTEKNFEVVIIDNASSDKTVKIIQQNFSYVTLVQNTKNYWYSKAYNTGIHISQGEYILICNHDIILEPNFLEEVSQAFTRDGSIGLVGGKVLKYPQNLPFKYNLTALKKSEKSFIIDTTGIQLFRNRRTIDRGESETDSGQYDTGGEVFGISGALVCYKRKVFDAIRYQNEFFDEHIVAYKDDVDASWRVRHAGYIAWYTPTAVAYHKRRVSRTTDLTDVGTIVNRLGRSSLDRIQGYKNQWNVLVKNDHIENFRKDFIFIFWYEFKKLMYILLFEQKTLKAIPQFFKTLRYMKLKRKRIFQKSHILAADMRKWLK